MRISRIFYPDSLTTDQQLLLNDNAARHVGLVLRLAVKDRIILFNDSGNNTDYVAEIIDKNKKKITVKILSEIKTCTKSVLNINLVQAVCRHEKMNWIIQKATELGVSHITPVMTDYCAFKPAEKYETKITHWKKIALSSCEQSGRNDAPVIAFVKPLMNWLNEPEINAGFVFNPRAELSFSKIMPFLNNDLKSKKISVLIGPEGGFSDKEIQFMQTKNFYFLRLGPRVLRTETAGIAAIAALQVLCGDFY